MASELINAVPDLKNKRYLELGVHLGQTFKAISCTDKTSVDPEHPATHQMTTDAFFAQLDESEKFDVVFIDACHEYEFVVRDFNSSIKHLSPDGLIFLHDLIPPEEKFIAPHYCGTAFRFLHHVITNCPTEYEYCSLASEYGDYGLSVFVNPTKEITPPPSIANISYKEFISNYYKINTCSVDEMKEFLRSTAQ